MITEVAQCLWSFIQENLNVKVFILCSCQKLIYLKRSIQFFQLGEERGGKIPEYFSSSVNQCFSGISIGNWYPDIVVGFSNM